MKFCEHWCRWRVNVLCRQCGVALAGSEGLKASSEAGRRQERSLDIRKRACRAQALTSESLQRAVFDV